MAIERFMLIGFAIILFLYICLCLALGEAQGGFFTDLRKTERPVAYWAHIAFAIAADALLVRAIFL